MSQPLAERMRPLSLDQYIGQKHLVGEGAVLNYAVLDKNVVINDKRLLSGYVTHPFYVKKSSVI